MAEQEIKTTISPISQGTKDAIAEKSVKYFPNNPSAAGKTPQQIKDAFTKPIIDAEVSIFTEIDRVIEEANEVAWYENQRITTAIQDISMEASNRYDADLAEKNAREEAIAGCVPKTALQGEGDPKAGNVPVYQEGYGSTSGEYFPILLTGYPMEDKHAANKNYVDDEITKMGEEVTAIRAGLAGNTRSYVIGDLVDLENMLEGDLDVGGRELVDVDTLLTGDNILLRQMNAPDFWFEKTETGTPPTYVYVEYDEEGNETEKIEYILSVKKDGTQVGVLHVLESDYSLIEGKAISAGKAAQEAQEAAQEVNNALGGYVKNTDYGTDTKPGIIKWNGTWGTYVNPTNGTLSLVQADKNDIKAKTNPYRPISSKMLDYAIKVGLTTNTETLTDEEKAAAQAWLGVTEAINKHHKQFTTREGATITKPEGAKNYAQIRELHGAISIYVQLADQGYRNFVDNYPKRIITDTRRVLFELSNEALAHLPGFGLQGNYIYFEDGIAYYKQTAKRENYGYEPDNREAIIEEIYDGGCIVRIDEIVTDVSEYIPFDGVIDTSGANSFSVEMNYTEEEVENMVADGYDNSYNDSYEYRMGKIKISFEV